jgi:hypothetical protein
MLQDDGMRASEHEPRLKTASNNLRIVIKAAFSLPLPYGWFIYRADTAEPVRRSLRGFRTMAEAFEEASAVLSGQ